MKKLFHLVLTFLVAGCQSESLEIQAPYRIKLAATTAQTTLQVHQPYNLFLELLTDSYYSKYGYQLQFYQQTGLGRLESNNSDVPQPVLQKVPINLPLGRSAWHYTPEATGTSQLVLIARQERGYTQPDTVRITFQVVP